MTAKLEQLGHYIGGQRVAGRSGRSAPVYNPALGVATTEVALASADETRAAIRPRARRCPNGPTRRRFAARACCSGSGTSSSGMRTSSRRS